MGVGVTILYRFKKRMGIGSQTVFGQFRDFTLLPGRVTSLSRKYFDNGWAVAGFFIRGRSCSWATPAAVTRVSLRSSLFSFVSPLRNSSPAWIGGKTPLNQYLAANFGNHLMRIVIVICFSIMLVGNSFNR